MNIRPYVPSDFPARGAEMATYDDVTKGDLFIIPSAKVEYRDAVLRLGVRGSGMLSPDLVYATVTEKTNTGFKYESKLRAGSPIRGEVKSSECLSGVLIHKTPNGLEIFIDSYKLDGLSGYLSE